MNYYFYLNQQGQSPLPPIPPPYPLHNPYYPPFLSPPFPFPPPPNPQPQGIQNNFVPLSNLQYESRDLEGRGERGGNQTEGEKSRRQVIIRKKREKNTEKETMSAKKNSESNLINHFFIFFTTKQCSQGQVERLLKGMGDRDLQKKVSIFYYLVKVINVHRGKKYMNKQILLKLFTEEGLRQSIPEVLLKIEQTQTFTTAQLGQILRKCFYFFIRQTSLICILTSKRISILSKQIHINRRTKIIQDFQNKYP